MNIISIPPIALATLMFYVGFYHFLIYLRQKSIRKNLTFAFSCLTVGLYAVCCSGLYNASSPEVGVQWQRFQVITLAGLAVAFLWFIADYTGKANKKVVIAFTVYYCFAALVGLFIRNDLTWTNEVSIKEIRLPLGYEIIYNEMAPGILTNIHSIMGIIYFLCILSVSLKYYRSENKKGLPLLLAMIMLFAGLINDTFVSSGFYDFIYILEYSYMGIILVFTFIFTNNVIKAGEVKIALHESEEKYRNLFEFTRDGLLLLDPDKGYVDCNPAALDLFKVESKEKLLKLTPADLSPQYQPDGALSSEKAELMIGKAFESGSNLFEWKHKRQNGEEFFASVLATRITLGGKTILQGTIRDISDFKRTQEMIIQSEKMLSLGGLAAGMAHEINNPLAGMIQTANVMANRLDKNIQMQANLEAADKAGTTIEAIHHFLESRSILQMIASIIESGGRVAEIVSNMLSFARKKEDSISFHNPVELLDNILELAATDYDLKKHYDFKNITIIKEYEENLPMVPCEVTQIQQVLLNILQNGAQAMEKKKGELAEYKPRFILRLIKETKADMLRIEVEDNGPGMDKKTCKRVFEPFFTTKPVGIGTGLGLSVSYFIITENHGGTMDVRSKPGEGATFIIRLPLK
ncbi:MAG: PAS domain S-box protein [Spirochaetaceae bacterium]|nr:PAS domain S-box protein [Spirochaetaceae bacterium]